MNKQKQKKTKQGPTRDRNGQVARFMDRDTVNLTMYKIQPPRALVKLQYHHSGTITQNGAGGASKSWNANGLYDIDPALASLSIAGFTEWATLYGANRVLRVNVKGSISNAETTPVYCGLGFVNGSVSSNSFRYTSYGNLHCKNLGILSPKGGQDRLFFNKSVDIEDVVGFYADFGDLTFYGTSSSNPSSIVSFMLGCESTSALLTTAGMVYDLTITLICEFTAVIRKVQL